MTLKLLPEMEVLLAGWLREHAALVALDARVAIRRPSTMSRPWIYVQQLNATDYPRARREHLVTYLFQLDVYAGQDAITDHTGWQTAKTVSRTTRGVLHSLRGTTQDDIAVSGVRFVDDRPLEDTDFEPPMERYVLTVELTAHALRT